MMTVSSMASCGLSQLVRRGGERREQRAESIVDTIVSFERAESRGQRADGREQTADGRR